MRDDLKHLLKVKDKLGEVSESFCLAKWMHVTLHLHSGQNHSCYHPPMHEIPKDLVVNDPSVLHNTPYKAEVRKQMLEGTRPSECSFCWSTEHLGGISDRMNISSSLHGFDLIDKKNPHQKIAPSYIEVSFSNSCNFKCSYCSPAASSKWAKEIQDKGRYDVYEPAINWIPPQYNSEDENPYVTAWWKWFPDVYPGLKYLRVTGGEPLLSESTFRILDWIIQTPNPELEFSINSNLGVPEKTMDRFVSKFKNISEGKLKYLTVYTSLDSWGKQAEYIRHGLDLRLFQENVEKYLKSFPFSRLSFMVTFQVLSLPRFTQFLEYLLDLKKRFNSPGFNRIDFSIDKLVRPAHQSMLILPESYNSYMEEIENFLKSRTGGSPYELSRHQLERFQTIFSWLKQNQEHEFATFDRADFYRFFTKHDAVRGTNFSSTFPELMGLWESCRLAHDKVESMDRKAYLDSQFARGFYPKGE